VDLSNTKWGVIESTQPHDRDGAPSRAQRVLRAGDTIVGTVRPGNGSYALVGATGLTGSTGFAALRPVRPACREFVYLAGTAPDNIVRLSLLADGAAYPAVRPEVILGTSVPIPGGDIIEAFHSLTTPLIERITANHAESETLAATRDLLLPRLMSGQLCVHDASRLVETVA
jgi:type I restriction enzyme S subunit